MKQLAKKILSILCVSVLLISCLASSGCQQEASGTLFALDTYITLRAYGRHAQAAVDQCTGEITRLENLLSTTRSYSDIYKINHQEGPVAVSDETAQLITRSLSITEETQGAFDITLRPLISLWGFEQEPRLPEEEELLTALSLSGAGHLSLTGHSVLLDPGCGVDLGGIAKGYITDRLVSILEEQKVPGAMLVLGGNVYAHGTRENGKPWRVGVQDPRDEHGIVGVVEAQDQCVITSGGYQRYFEQDGITYHHILSPETGYPADSGFLSVTIVSSDGTLADALSTALFVMGPEKAEAYWKSHPGFGFVAVLEDGSLLVTEDCHFTPETGFAATILQKG